MSVRNSARSSELVVSARALRWAVLVGAAAAAFATTSVALGAFNSLTSGGPMTVATKRIFPAVRSTSAWSVRDASAGGAEANSDDRLSYADGLLRNTANWATTFAANRYLEFDFNSVAPGGVAVSSAQFNFRFASGGGGETGCFYVEVYRASTSTLIGTHGSTGAPLGCESAGTQTTYTVTLAEVTTTAILNDLRVRAYGYEDGGNPLAIDMATVTGATPYANFKLYEKIYRDRANGTVATTNWGTAIAGDNFNYQSTGNWATTFSTTRYVKTTFDPGVPTGSVITSASFDFYYRSNTAGNTVCWYMETYNGATLLAAHGSPGTPISCNTGNTTYSSDNVLLPELTNVADANNLTIKTYMKESGSAKTQLDLARLNLNYYLN